MSDWKVAPAINTCKQCRRERALNEHDCCKPCYDENHSNCEVNGQHTRDAYALSTLLCVHTATFRGSKTDKCEKCPKLGIISQFLANYERGDRK